MHHQPRRCQATGAGIQAYWILGLPVAVMSFHHDNSTDIITMTDLKAVDTIGNCITIVRIKAYFVMSNGELLIV